MVGRLCYHLSKYLSGCLNIFFHNLDIYLVSVEDREGRCEHGGHGPDGHQDQPRVQLAGAVAQGPRHPWQLLQCVTKL